MPTRSPARTANPKAPTRLARALRDAPAAKATPLDLYQLARRDWLAGERIDIGALAARLNIGRATAFRWAVLLLQREMPGEVQRRAGKVHREHRRRRAT